MAARDAATVDNPAYWSTTVTSRLALDRLRAQRRMGEKCTPDRVSRPGAYTARTPRKRPSLPSR